MTQADIIRAKILTDTLFATRYFFRMHENRQFIVGEHHKLIAEKLDRVFGGSCKRLIINCPPRYSKTEMVVKTLIAKGLAINPMSKYIHLSYSANVTMHMPLPANHHHSSISDSKQSISLVLAKLYAYMQTTWSNCANPTTRCKFAHSFGCTTVFLLPTTKVATWNKFVMRAVTPWERTMM